MYVKADDPRVVGTINELNGVVQWGFKDRNNVFIPINHIRQEGKKLYYLDEATNSERSVSTLIKEVRGERGDRWLRCVWFKDGLGNEVILKKHLEKRHDGLYIK